MADDEKQHAVQTSGPGAALPDAESIVETVREPLVVLDGNSRVLRANRSFYQAFGLQPEETEGRLLYDLGNRQWDIPRLRTLLEEILPNNTFVNGFEVVHDFPSIGRKVMLLNARRIYREGNHTEWILLAIEDITERGRAEAARQEIETRFTSLVKNIKDHSIFTTDPVGRITSWNVEAERILGHSEAEALGQHFSIIFTPEDVGRGQPEVELRTAKEQGRAEDERWHIRKNGALFWALGTFTPTHDTGGKHTGFSKILRDLTDRKQLEAQLRQRVDELAEADRRKDVFLAMLAHELRNPLAPVRNFLHIIQQPAVNDIALAQLREMAERQVQHMGRLLDDLLDVSRIGRGLIELQNEPVDLTTLVNRTVEAGRTLAEQRRHQLTVSLAPEPLHVEGDPTRLEQVVTNLLNNACKYTDPGGHIRLTVGREGGAVVLSVRDDGIGIAPDMLSSIFDLFVQAERRLERSQGGVGIGLTLVKRLVELHGGSIEAHSQGLGKGSEFIIRLPALKVHRGGEEEQKSGSADAGALPRRRILVVDDNHDAADSLAMLLRLAGQEVRVAYDGPSGLTQAREFLPELVCLDIGMPGMDGYEAARRLREEPELRGIVLVALTGWGQEEDRRRSREAGFNYHLVKPVEPDDLQKLMARLEP